MDLWRIVTIVLATFAVAGALQAGPSSTTPQIGTTTAGLTDSLKSFFTRLWSPATSGAEQQGTAYLYDEQGNLISETGTGGANSTGSTQYIYLPTANGPMPIVAVINGQPADEESGLFENRDRFYGPSLGRYTQGDAFGLSAGTNRFIYALDDPLGVFDDDGLAPKKPNGAAPAPYSPLLGGVIKPSPIPGWQPLQLGVPGRARLGGEGLAGAGRGVVGPFCPSERGDVAKGGARSVDELSQAATAADRGGLTAAGRALQKHGAREGSAFAAAKGNSLSVNQQGQHAVDDILTSPGSTTVTRNHARFGQVTEVRAPDGLGVRYGADGNFIGFLEPHK